MRIMLGITTSLNFKVKGFHCDFNEKIYIKQFKRFEVKNNKKLVCKMSRVFGNMVFVAFQSDFHLEKHVNNVFLFFKNHF